MKSCVIDGESVLVYIIPVTGNGACLFNCLSLGLFGTEKYSFQIRKDIVDHIVLNFNHYGNFMTNNMTFRQYEHYMVQPQTFGTYIEIVAASAVFQIRILVYRMDALECDVGKGFKNKNFLLSEFTGHRDGGHFNLAWPANRRFYPTPLPYINPSLKKFPDPPKNLFISGNFEEHWKNIFENQTNFK